MVFEITEVILGHKHEEDGGGNELDFNRDRDEEEERPSYVITVKNKKKREIVKDQGMLGAIAENEEAEEEE